MLPVSDWDLSTRYGKPTAYRLTVPEIGGGKTQTALAAEVLHLRIGSDTSQPWIGQAPLRRASITASPLESLETALSEVYQCAPLGTSIVPTTESNEADLNTMAAALRGKRERTLLKESMQVQAAGGMAPATDWAARSLSPDLYVSFVLEADPYRYYTPVR